ncbi:uncharacterized protein EV422DRAFT_568784 [Fimicolochytrium jonesii]|uniref:uncharacterized protein n=1 Tax=Fimicolochytrium jonesii TaxID=1396493 RepID=UPI0022FE5F88|nr:uncharacterized protein EV422DRAFT_568784 [Fimicolochytrium jonesii]KAI8819352.1 hypothetical protein EV422DRAFT_568784 [Fimicolochytrium jonesii]
MVNSPLPTDMAAECKKAAKTIEHFIKPATGRGPDQLIPSHVIANAKGIAVLTVIKAGFLFTGRAGSGLVIAKLEDGSWSAPSAIGTAGMGVGGQIGAELTDFVIILNTKDAVRAFCHGGNITLGGNLSVAAGPVGRNVEAAGTIGNLAAIFSYSKTRGLFAGVSIEGSAIIERKDANASFYNRKVSAKEILTGGVTPPPAADDLYRALDIKFGAIAEHAAANPHTPGQGFLSNFKKNSNNSPPPVVPPSPAAAAAIVAATPFGTQQPTPVAQPAQWANLAGAPTEKVGGFVRPSGPAVVAAPPPPPARKTSASAIAMYDFAGERADDLSFRKGDIIAITKQTNNQNDWWTGRCNGREGAFPANYVVLQ